MNLRIFVLLAALGVLAATGQLAGVRWGLAGEAAGSLAAGLIVLIGWRVVVPGMEQAGLLPFVAIAASLLGLFLGIAGSAIAYAPSVWIIPLLAGLPTGVPALRSAMRGPKCHLCRMPLRRLLSFSCPRCHLTACEHCWEFERGRCHLCAANQVPLFPVDTAWWQMHFGAQAYDGRCALCLRTPDWRIAHWACPSCGHAQCRLCWDDNNGQCSRCEWNIPNASLNATASTGREAQRNKMSHEEEMSRAQIPDAVRHSSR